MERPLYRKEHNKRNTAMDAYGEYVDDAWAVYKLGEELEIAGQYFLIAVVDTEPLADLIIESLLPRVLPNGTPSS